MDGLYYSKKIRFWHYGNGAVLITLRKGQTLNHSTGGPTDEGWHRESNTWTFDGHTVVCVWRNDGADCDGRLTRHGVSWFPIHDAKAGYHDAELGAYFPDWRGGQTHQRDYSAEAMGY